MNRVGKGKAVNIRIYQDTKKDFEELGKYGENADDILRRLLCTYDVHQQITKPKFKSIKYTRGRKDIQELMRGIKDDKN